MASLFIKDTDTADHVARMAERLNTTKTDAVRRGMKALEASLPTEPQKQNWLDWIAERRRTHPLPPRTGMKADKEFFDKLWGEE